MSVSYLESKSIVSLSEKFEPLEIQAIPGQYSISIVVKVFTRLAGVNLKQQHQAQGFLEELFAEDLAFFRAEAQRGLARDDKSILQVSGTFEECLFRNVEEKVLIFFSYMSVGKMGVDRRLGSDIHLKKLSQFWSLVSEYFSLPPAQCIEYIPGDGPFLGKGTAWDCSFIFLEEATRKGMFVYLGGSL